MAEHPNAPRCHHVRTNGLRCGSPAMRNNKHCYYHRKTLGSPRNPRRAELTNLEDGNAIQLAIAHLDRRLDMGTIEYRAAHIKADLYRLALRNLKNMNPDPCNHKDVVTFDPTLEDDDTSTAAAPPAATSAAPTAGPSTTEPITTEPITTEPITTERITTEPITAEPITYDQELDLIDEGTLTAREATTTAPHLSPNDDPSPVEMAHERVALTDFGKRETGNGKPSPKRETRNEKPVFGKPETGNPERSFEDLSDKEQEEMIMRLSKNDAHVLPDDTSKQPPESIADFGELVAILRKELAG